jgi:UrcA family protein
MMSEFNSTRTGLAALLLLAAFGGGTVAAAPPGIRVGYGDLDLGSPAGLDRITHRLRQAAERVCGESGVRPLRESIARRHCVVTAIESARPRLEQAIADRRGAAFAARRSAQAVR